MPNILTNTTLARKDRLRDLKAREPGYFDLEFIKAMPPEHRNTCIDLLDKSRSQLRQDIFGLLRAGFKRNGFFIEFGATDGIELNNSYLMENSYGWSGILAEPARRWQNDLSQNRACTIDTRCVWKETGQTLQFTESTRGENSAISSFMRKRRRLRGTQYDVSTVSLNDLLHDHNAPQHIDFASIDTEGSEFEILAAFDFSRWTFGALCIEHNYAPQRSDLHRLLTANGYQRILEPISRFDDWYVPAQ